VCAGFHLLPSSLKEITFQKGIDGMPSMHDEDGESFSKVPS
jgi:hypothetical protein